MKLYICIIIVLLLVGCTAKQEQQQQFVSINFSGKAIINAEVAYSEQQRETGLMNRDYLAPSAGMLFVFPNEDYWSFWMKNTKISLDMIFISSDLVVVDIKTNIQPCATIVCEHYAPDRKAKYIVEVNAGFAAEKNITIGDSVSIDFPD